MDLAPFSVYENPESEKYLANILVNESVLNSQNMERLGTDDRVPGSILDNIDIMYCQEYFLGIFLSHV